MRKKMSIMAMVLVLFLTFTFTSEKAYQKSYAQDYLVGDVNGDQKIDVDDAVEILRQYAQISAAVKDDVINDFIYDVNLDYQITVEDAVKILEYYAKKAAGLSITWPDFQYKFGEILSANEPKMLISENGDIQYINKGQKIMILDAYNDKYIVVFNEEIYYLNTQYRSFQLIDTVNEDGKACQTYPKIGNILKYCNPKEDLTMTMNNGSISYITNNEKYAILEILPYGEFKVIKENGDIGRVTISLEYLKKYIYDITPEL